MNKEKVLACRIAWMREYRGDVLGDPPYKGGKFPEENVVAGEVLSFRPVRGRCYGYVQAPGRGGSSSELGRLDLASHFAVDGDAEFVDGVMVIWFAADPKGGGQKVVGVYRNARVYAEARDRSPHRPITYQGKEFTLPYNIEVAEDDARLVPVTSRRCVVPGPGSPGAPGMAMVSYLDGSTNAEAVQRLRTRLVSYAKSRFDDATVAEDELRYLSDGGSDSGQGYGLTAEQREVVAMRAVQEAIRHFTSRSLGFQLQGEYHPTGPYDLVFEDEQGELHVEVKGTTGPLGTVIVTEGEVQHAKSARCALFVLHGIALDRGAEPPTASGGTKHVLLPWRPRREDLTPTAYRYQLTPVRVRNV